VNSRSWTYIASSFYWVSYAWVPISQSPGTSGLVTTLTLTPSSGASFVPNLYVPTNVYVPVAATTSGTVKITMGPSSGTENTPVPVSNLVALSEPTFTLARVPAGWKVIVTITGTTVAIGTVTVVTDR
jgi:hypothetical protein